MTKIPAWAVYRRVPRSPEFEFVGLVLAKTWRDGLALAKRLPDAPREPIVAHALQQPGRVALASAEDLPVVEPARRMRTRRKAFVVGAVLAGALALSGCDEPTPEQVQRARDVLPAGCKIYDVGEYGSVSHMVVVSCPDATTTTLFSYPSGKTSVPVAIVHLGRAS